MNHHLPVKYSLEDLGPEPIESIVLWNPSIRKSVRPDPLESIVLWNPSIRKSVRIGIPKLPRQVYLLDGLLCSPRLRLSKRNECLSVLDYESNKNHIAQDLLEFRKNGDAIIETIKDDDNFVLQVYDPLGRISGDLGMEGSYFSFSIRSYKEMLLLLDE
nr:hypothetical protein [Tanacetum cinerariifolium]